MAFRRGHGLLPVLVGLALAVAGCEGTSLIELLPPDPDAAGVGSDAGPVDAGEAGQADAGPLDAGNEAGSPDDGGQELPEDASGTGGTGGLLVRYDFSGTGTAVIDRVGGADGIVLGGAELSGNGDLRLDGDDDYVDLPNGLISGLTAATFMVWVEWDGGVCWQRVFDFGSNDQGEDQVGNVVSSLFLTAQTCGREGAAVFVELGPTQYVMLVPWALPIGHWLQVALTVDPARNRMRLYVDGELLAQGATPFSLADIDDENVWLGRSQWVQDATFNGRFDEFRLYDRALSGTEIRDALQRGPDAP